MQTSTAQRARPDGLRAALSLVGSQGYDAAKSLWNDEMSKQERRVFLIAARLPMDWDRRTWAEIGDIGRAEVKESMLRFYRRFSPLLEKLEVQEGVC